MAKKYSLIGPIARASGIEIDTRKDYPYEAYNEVDFSIPTEKKGDAQARMLVRLREIPESIKIIKQLLRGMPKRKVPEFKPTRLEHGFVHAAVEAPRGENFHLIHVEDHKIVRARIRTPTFAVISVLTELLVNREIVDVPVILSSLDPCFACMERVIVVKDKKQELLNEHEFKHKYC